jgi:ribose transport system ATP-binding protein
VLYISHRLEEVTRLADRVTVLRDGKRIATHAASELSSDAMVELMSGEVTGTSARHTHRSHAGERTVLSVRGLARGSAVREASFEVRGGERLGITGLVGSGRTELLRALFGADRAKTGEVRVGDDAKPRRFAHPSQAVAAGLAMVTEDRKANGLLLSQPIRVNATLCALSRSFARFGLILSRAERSATDRMRQRLQIHCTGIQQRTGTLSGGNQQKVVVAKWLVRDAEVFLFDEPTRGIDVAARRKIYGIIEELAARGKGIVIVSSDLEELLETCDRIAVISAGRIAATFDRGEWSRDRITRAAFSGYVQAEPGPSR